MDHLGEQSVLELVAGELAGPRAAPIHDHLDRCGDCRALVAALLRAGETGPDLARASAPTGATVIEPAAAGAQARPPIDRIDEYRLLDVLGRGGMGTVYRAHDTLLDREVALKLIARTGSDAARQRFVVEARAVARVRHPNVVVVHRVGLAGDQPYIVYELVRGRTFGELRAPLAWPKVLELATGVLRGLAAAHACNVLHRDVKPANLMLDEHGDVILVDFGLARLAGDGAAPAAPALAGAPAAGDLRLTATGAALGTPRYMAPEAWRGGELTAQTDLYSLGVVLYELLAGRPPFAGGDARELARRVCDEDAPPIAGAAPWIPPLFGALIDRCLARDPGARPVSAAALGGELEALQRGRAFEAFERDRVRRAPAGNPYPGARPFGLEHQGVLFGRGRELRALVDQLRERPFVVVAGDAGAGKTSLCLAGLLPIVARGALGGARRWVPVPVTPGRRPLAALAGALAGHVELPPAELGRLLAEDPAPVVARFRAGHRGGCTAHVLFVDPLDDLLAAPPDDARRFAAILGLLAEPAPALRVLATVRATNLLAVAQLPGLGPAISAALYLLLEPRDEAALREIILEPARLSGRALDPPAASSLLDAATRGELALGELAARLSALWDASA